MKSYTLVDPDAVMVKLYNAETTHTAVFRSSWFLDFTCATLDTLFKDYAIEFKTFKSMNDCALV